jgi:hypothetical protein
MLNRLSFGVGKIIKLCYIPEPEDHPVQCFIWLLPVFGDKVSVRLRHEYFRR